MFSWTHLCHFFYHVFQLILQDKNLLWKPHVYNKIVKCLWSVRAISDVCDNVTWCLIKTRAATTKKNRQINRWKTQLFFTDSIQPIDAVVLSSAAAFCESSRVWETKFSRFWSFSFKVCGFFFSFLLLWIWCKFPLTKSLTKKISKDLVLYFQLRYPIQAIGNIIKQSITKLQIRIFINF